MQEIDYGQDDLTTIRPSMICNRRDDTTIIRAGELWYGPNATIESVQYFLANLQNIVTNNQNDSSILPALLEHTKNLLTAMQKTASILQGEFSRDSGFYVQVYK